MNVEDDDLEPMTRREIVELLETITRDVLRGGPTFLAVTVLSRNAMDPHKPVVMVVKFRDEATPERVCGAVAGIVKSAIKMGALVPD